MSDITRYSESPLYNTDLLNKVQEGMDVVDASGDRIGTVSYISMGDPDAASNQGNEVRDPGILTHIPAGGFGTEYPTHAGIAVFGGESEPDVEEPLRSQLLHSGFIKVAGSGLFADKRYVRLDDIVDVTDDTVHLASHKEDLPKED
jgi:hypothetical protein